MSFRAATHITAPADAYASARGSPRRATAASVIYWTPLDLASDAIVVAYPDSRALLKPTFKQHSKMLPLQLEHAIGAAGPMDALRVALCVSHPPREPGLIQSRRAQARPVITPRAASARASSALPPPTVGITSARGGRGASAAATWQHPPLAPATAAFSWDARHEAQLRPSRASTPGQDSAAARIRARAAPPTPGVWSAALRPSSAVRPTTPAWGLVSARAAVPSENAFPVVACGERTPGVSRSYAGERFLRFECSVCAAYNAAAGLHRSQNLNTTILVPLRSGEGAVSSRPHQVRYSTYT